MRAEKFRLFNKLKKLDKSTRHNICIIGIISIIIIFFIILVVYESLAIYRIIHEHSLLETKVEPFKISDIRVAVYVDGERKEQIPSKESGKLYQKTECDNSGIAVWNDTTWKMAIKDITDRTDCTIYFVTGFSLNEKILADNGGEVAIVARGMPNYTTSAISLETYRKLEEFDVAGITATSKRKIKSKSGTDITYQATSKYSVSNGLYKTRSDAYAGEDNYGVFTSQDDNDGASYYYRGDVNNNFVIFGGFWWRIIRINGDGSIRLIYNGTSTEYGTETQIGTSRFSGKNLHSDNAYVGYTYGGIEKTNYKNTHVGTTSSEIKTFIDNWYENNIYGKEFEKQVEKTGIFCGDRNMEIEHLGYEMNTTSYGEDIRLNMNKKPSLQCKNKTIEDEKIDQYGIGIDANRMEYSDIIAGNQKLLYPVGLITADEVALAGGVFLTGYNGDYWLYTGQNYWTMSPYAFNLELSDGAFTGFVNTNGNLISALSSIAYGVRPVINLKKDILIAGGNGTVDNPYKIS